MAQRNRLTHLVPALLTVISALPALDGIAPVITVPDLITTGPSIRAGVSNPVPALVLDQWIQDIHFLQPATDPPVWISLDQSPGGTLPTALTAGVAIVGQSGDGVWAYGVGNPRTWTTIAGRIETSALLLPLRDSNGYSVALRFTPNLQANPPGPAALILRAWDGSSGVAFQTASTANNIAGAAAPNGGSPTAFSAETRRLETTILPSGTNAPPVVTLQTQFGSSLPNPITLLSGQQSVIKATASDPDGDEIAWSASALGYLASSVTVSTPSVQPDGSALITVTANNPITVARSGTVQVTATDGTATSNPASANVAVAITPPNQPPNIISPFSAVAVVGQPWETVLTVSDSDGDTNLSLAAVQYLSSSLPAGFTLRQISGQPTWILSGTPTTVGSIGFRLTCSDGISTPVPVTEFLTVGDPPVATSSLSTLPVSTPGNPVYAAIAPGSAPGFSALLSALQPHGPDIARGWWYSSGFRDIEEQTPGNDSLGLDLKPRTGVFLASTVSLGSVDFSTKPFPMPFRITLRPNAWTFFGVPPLWDGQATSSSHAWSDFRLDRANGTTVDDQDEVVDVLGGASADTPREPYGYDPINGYDVVSTMLTGLGYWVYNSSPETYQIVRISSNDETSLRVTNASRYRLDFAVASATARDITPPAPPRGGATSAKAEPSGGSCGAGGLGGLLLAGLALIGLRRRN